MRDVNQYQAYLLRLERGKGQQGWRATLTNAHSGDVQRFATERDLICYLLQSLRTDTTDRRLGS